VHQLAVGSWIAELHALASSSNGIGSRFLLVCLGPSGFMLITSFVKSELPKRGLGGDNESRLLVSCEGLVGKSSMFSSYIFNADLSGPTLIVNRLAWANLGSGACLW
jgi:hypothetical protein